MEYKHLRIYPDGVYLIGYRMPLCPSELRVLTILLKNTVARNQGMTSREILAQFSENDIRLSNITVHICAINKKAVSIGGRRLVVFRDGKYYLNEFM